MKIRCRLAAIASVTAITATMGLAGTAPAGASALQRSAPGAAHGVLTVHAAVTPAGTRAPVSVKPDFTLGVSYYIEDFGGYYLGWDGTFKDQVHTYTKSNNDVSVFIPIAAVKSMVGGLPVYFYQWAINGGQNCLEYDSATTAVIADTCTAGRTSQLWWYDSGNNAVYNRYDLDYLWAQALANNAPVYAESSRPTTDQDQWTFPSA